MQQRAIAVVATNVQEVYTMEADRKVVHLPFYSSHARAGFPSPADDHVERRLDPTTYLIRNDNATFCVRVRGDSMIGALIFDNDVIIVDRSIEAKAGDIVLAALDGEYTVKTLGITPDHRPRLIPANEKFPVIEPTEAQWFEVFGVVVGSMRKFR
jgi:DNA polymerase V